MTDRYRKVPSARLSRLAVFGQMAGGVAGGMLAEGARRVARGERPHLSDMLLTPANATRVTEQLSRLRGAAMKLGQMISLDGGDMLPPELTAILAKLRDSANFMPPAQLQKVLATHWGRDWRRRFAQFEATPVAAASIGQVHRARLPDGQVVAVKVQYPGVAASIDADVDNVATLLRISGLLPATLDLAPLLAAAKAQLKEEADYCREADQMERYGALLAGDAAFVVPRPHRDLSSREVLVMDFIEGRPIDDLAHSPQAERDRVMESLMRLVLKELFTFGFMQTDPNFANYRWQPDGDHGGTGRIVLLDFGAARAVPQATSQAYRALLSAGLAADHGGVLDALMAGDFISAPLLERHGPALDAAIAIILAHLHRPGLFDFADRSFVAELVEAGKPIGADRASWHIPPADTLFVQRKVSGTALLAVRMKARLPLTEMVAEQIGSSALSDMLPT